MKYLYIALVLSCLIASTFAACTGNVTDIGEWDDNNELSAGCPSVTFTIDTSAALKNETIIAAVHIPDDEDGVKLTISYVESATNTSANSTSSDENDAQICIDGTEGSATMSIVVSSNITLAGGNVTQFSFYYDIEDSCEEISSPSGGFPWGWVILGLVVVVLIVVIIAAVAGFMIWKKRQSQDKYIYDDA